MEKVAFKFWILWQFAAFLQPDAQVIPHFGPFIGVALFFGGAAAKVYFNYTKAQLAQAVNHSLTAPRVYKHGLWAVPLRLAATLAARVMLSRPLNTSGS